MKGKLAALAALTVLCNLAMAQDKPWKVEKIYQGGAATMTMPETSIQATWDAATKVLFKMRKMEVDGDKQSGTIRAHRPGAAITILLYQQEEGVEVNAKWEFVGGEKVQLRSPVSQAARFFDEFFPALIEAMK